MHLNYRSTVNRNMAPLFVHRNLWWYIEDGGKSKYSVNRKFLFTDFHDRRFRVALYQVLTLLIKLCLNMAENILMLILLLFMPCNVLYLLLEKQVLLHAKTTQYKYNFPLLNISVGDRHHEQVTSETWIF